MKPDLFLSQDGFIPLGASCKQLNVIHDINFLHHPKDLKWLTGKYYNTFFPKFAKRADRLVTVSEYSKKDICKNYGIDPGKIDVVYNGIHPFFQEFTEEVKAETRKKFSHGESYFVYVGSILPRKNIVNLAKAFAIFKDKSKSKLKLVIAGRQYWGMDEIYREIKQSGMEGEVIFTGRLDDLELAKVLASSLALTYVPYYEGFGIPVIEAMQANVPVITSNVTSLPEVAGDAALLVDPLSPDSISDAMLKLYSDPTLQKELIEKGRKRKMDFSWEKSAADLWASIMKTIQEN